MLKLIEHFAHKAALDGLEQVLKGIHPEARDDWGVQVLHGSTPPSGFFMELNVAHLTPGPASHEALRKTIESKLDADHLLGELIKLYAQSSSVRSSSPEDMGNLGLLSRTLSHILKDSFSRPGPSLLSISKEEHLSSIQLGSIGPYSMQAREPALSPIIQRLGNELSRQADQKPPLHEQILDRLKRIEGIHIIPGKQE